MSKGYCHIGARYNNFVDKPQKLVSYYVILLQHYKFNDVTHM